MFGRAAGGKVSVAPARLTVRAAAQATRPIIFRSRWQPINDRQQCANFNILNYPITMVETLDFEKRNTWITLNLPCHTH